MRCIDEVSASELKGKRVLARVDFNLPIGGQGEVTDIFRVERAWATIRFLSEAGAKVILLSHLTKNPRNPENSMTPVVKALTGRYKLFFVPDIIGSAAHAAADAMHDGDVILLENVRRDPREQQNDESFARELASLADVYVNDSFAVDHREHASLVTLPKLLPHYAGLLVREEVQHLDAARAPHSPSFAILGGAKFESKAPLIRLLLEKYDKLLIVGAIGNDVIKAQGHEVGRSLVSKELPDSDLLKHPHFVAPVDVTVESPDGHASVKKADAVSSDEKIVDIGPDTVASVAPFASAARSLLWSGPTGMYENGYLTYTEQLARAIEEAVAHGGTSVIGGGDTVAALEAAGMGKANLGFLSTGGGAMLDYLLKGTLPGIQALG